MSTATASSSESRRGVPFSWVGRLGWVIGGMIALEVVMLALAFLWVAIYAYGIHPGENEAFYQEYAKVASPVVAVVISFPVFFAAAWWVGRRTAARAAQIVVGMVALYVVFDVFVIATVAEDLRYNALMALTTLPFKLAGSWLGWKTGTTR